MKTKQTVRGGIQKHLQLNRNSRNHATGSKKEYPAKSDKKSAHIGRSN